MSIRRGWPVFAAPLSALFAALPSACGTEVPALEVIVADSAGVPVIVNPPSLPAEHPAWTLDPEPAVTFGALAGSPEYQLHQVQGARVLSDGTVAVANGATRELRYFDGEGRHLRSVGGQGDGPGEFQWLTIAGRFDGDSLLLWDPQRRRASVVDGSGSFVRAFALDSSDEAPNPMVEAALSDGTLLVRNQAILSGADIQEGLNRGQTELHLTTLDGTARGFLGAFPGPETFIATMSGGFMSTFLTFGRRLQSSARGDRIALGANDGFSIRVYDREGNLLHVVRQDREPVRTTPADYQDLARKMSERSASSAFEEVLDAMPRPPTFPAFSAIHLDDAGYLWVEEYDWAAERRLPTTEPGTWQIFDPDGRLVARIQTPPRFYVLDIGEDYLLGLHMDDFEVETLQLHRLTRAP